MGEIQQHRRVQGDIFAAISRTPAGRITVRVLLLQGEQDLTALPHWSQRYAERVTDEGRAAGLAHYRIPQAEHSLRVAGESDEFRRARLQRVWETLVGWAEDGVRPGPILGIAPQPAAR